MKIKKTIEFPEEVLLSLRTDENEFIDEMKKTMAIKYFANKKLSIGQSAELADMSMNIQKNTPGFLNKNNSTIIIKDM